MSHTFRRRHVHVLIALLSLMPFASLAAQEAQETEQEQERKLSGFVFLPVLYYTPETKLAVGAAVQYYFRPADAEADSRPSTIMPVFIYTARKQIVAGVFTELYWRQEEYRSEGYAGFSKFPDKFWGIGNDTPDENEEDYTPQFADLRVDLQKRVYSALRLGLGYQFQHSRLKKVEEGGLLDSGEITGSDGGSVSGAAALASWDTRDNVFFPSSGSYHQLRLSGFGSVLGSDFDFGRYILDLRFYARAFSYHVLALQGYFGLESGDPPFQNLQLLGGENLMRGYWSGRYRDRDMIVLQAEYRIVPVLWRFGLAAFAGVGDVAHELDGFEIANFKYTVGGGIRYLLSREEKITLRMDFGVGAGTSGFYLTFGEAF